MVHLNAQCLEHAGQVLFLPFARHERLDHLEQIVDGFEVFCVSSLHYGGGKATAILEFAVEEKHIRQPLFGVVVHQIGRLHSGPPVHSHIERSVKTEGEASLFCIEVVARHAEIGNQSVDSLHPIVTHPVCEIAEVASHKGKAFVTLRNVVLGVGILVKTVEMAIRSEASENFAAMSAAAEGNIDVGATGLHVKPVNTGLQ